MHLVVGPADEGASASVEDGVGGGAGTGHLLGDLVAQVLDQNLVAALVEHREPVAGDENGRAARPALRLLRRPRSGFRIIR